VEPETPQEETNHEVRPAPRLWMGYVIPMVAFVLLTAGEGMLPKSWYLGLYTAKACVTAALLILYRSVWKDIRPDWRVLPIAILVGIAVFFEWIFVDRITPHFALLGARTGFDPNTIQEPLLRVCFVAVRLTGLAILVPIMEELFWRSFLLRWLTDPDFAKIPMGTFSWGAFAMVAGAFGLAHPEWLAGILCGVIYSLLLRKTKSLLACIVAHAVTNLALGIYILGTHQWYFW